MSEVLHEFPSTPHLCWLGDGGVRGDKVMTDAEVEAFLSEPVLVEEKVDGANLGLSFDANGRLRLQNRGNWLEGKLTGQWERLRVWAAEHEALLRSVLPDKHILFGEWCYAIHSIRYQRLPDWFVAFDVYDPCAGRFWTAARRNLLSSAAQVATVPILSRGVFRQDDLDALLDGPSAYADGPREGLYLRREDVNWLVSRAKLVRSEFTQTIAEHWSRKPITPNEIRRAPAVSK